MRCPFRLVDHRLPKFVDYFILQPMEGGIVAVNVLLGIWEHCVEGFPDPDPSLVRCPATIGIRGRRVQRRIEWTDARLSFFRSEFANELCKAFFLCSSQALSGDDCGTGHLVMDECYKRNLNWTRTFPLSPLPHVPVYIQSPFGLQGSVLWIYRRIYATSCTQACYGIRHGTNLLQPFQPVWNGIYQWSRLRLPRPKWKSVAT